MNKGYLPLHFAAFQGCSKHVMKLLLQNNLSAVAKKTNGNDYPLHLVFYNYGTKFELDTGDSVHEGYLSVRKMVKKIVNAYFERKREQKGKEDAMDKLRRFILNIRGSDGKSIFELVKDNAPECVMEEFERTLQGSKGRIVH